MAEQIERNGAAFYRRASEVATHPRVKQRLIQLAEWEGGHEKLFTTLRSALTGAEAEPPTFDPDGDAARYLKEMADRHVFHIHRDVSTILSGKETPEQVLDIAIGFERDSILFFRGLEIFVPPSLGRHKVQALIDEEIGHVAFLSREKEELKSN
jgi:rubrerythrin